MYINCLGLTSGGNLTLTKLRSHSLQGREPSTFAIPTPKCSRIQKRKAKGTESKRSSGQKRRPLCINRESNARPIDGNDRGYHYPINALVIIEIRIYLDIPSTIRL